jgi:hypothetical protein
MTNYNIVGTKYEMSFDSLPLVMRYVALAIICHEET